MKFGRVIGNVETVQKHPFLEKLKLLLIQPLNLYLEDQGTPFVAFDTVGAGAGEKVLIIQEGRSARQYTGKKYPASRTMVIAIIDQINIDQKFLPKKNELKKRKREDKK